ncbi:response regulator transcription factor [Cohnella algarum]|uniref:response regulator transcription factor n=1 Tax=Cohnella algarum TaxID=2044859 RepID=UPI00196846B3|nr:helix-turn-helix domain-containing protein [Cohnella algarum]MBN2982322.1 response regulator [Cohnella algarum]
MMQWRALIVDDEPVIRMGIKASVDWAAEQIELAGDCANGAEALEVIARESVHILITDIKMPIMDGLTLASRAMAVNPRIKVVLVSSYNDFEYVRQGLKIGAIDYILKHTLEPEELLLVIRKCKELLVEEQRKERLHQRPNEMSVRDRMRFEQELKRHLVHRTEHLPEDGYPSWVMGLYRAMYVKLNRVYAIEEQQGYLFKSVLLDQLVDSFYRVVPNGVAIQTAENELFFVLPSGVPEAVEISKLKQALEKDSDVTVTIGHTTGSGHGSLRECFLASREAAERGFFKGAGIYDHRDPVYVRAAGKRLPSTLLPYAADEDESGIDRSLREWCSEWENGGISPAVLKEEACRVLSLMYKHSVDPYALVESFDRLFKTESLPELSRLLKEQIFELRKHKTEVQTNQAARNPIDRALDYINARYLESLTLQEVADAVHVSKNYFSILFKKITGHNFIDYVILLRVQKARELLVTTDLKVYEVAEQSGFNDVKYFSKLFKKMTGCSPVDYRDKQMASADGFWGAGGNAE